MTSLFDIFRVFSDAEPLWLEAAVTLDDAMARVRQIGAVQAGEYCIHSHKTDVEICMTVPRPANFGTKVGTHSEPLTVRHRESEK